MYVCTGSRYIGKVTGKTPKIVVRHQVKKNEKNSHLSSVVRRPLKSKATLRELESLRDCNKICN